jgi:CBS domain-containing protein
MSRMSQHRVGQLPVLDGDELAGIVTVGDLIQAMYEQIETENQHMLTYVYGRT